MTASNPASIKLSEVRTVIRHAIMVYARRMFPSRQYAYTYQGTPPKAVHNSLENSMIERINDNGKDVRQR